MEAVALGSQRGSELPMEYQLLDALLRSCQTQRSPCDSSLSECESARMWGCRCTAVCTPATRDGGVERKASSTSSKARDLLLTDVAGDCRTSCTRGCFVLQHTRAGQRPWTMPLIVFVLRRYMLSGETWDALNVRGCKRTSVLRCREQLSPMRKRFTARPAICLCLMDHRPKKTDGREYLRTHAMLQRRIVEDEHDPTDQ